MSGVRKWFFMIVSVIMAGIHAEPIVSGQIVPSVSVSVSMEKEYGYFIGDLVRVSYRIILPRDGSLWEESLPKENESVDEWLDIRDRKITQSSGPDARTYDLDIVYQLFSAAANAQAYQIPSFEFMYGSKNQPSVYVSSLPAVMITVSPLTAPADSFKPHLFWSWASPSWKYVRLAGAALMMMGGGLAAVLFARRGRKRSLFKAALERLSAEKDPAAALVIFRNALNEKAGQAIFPGNLNELLRVFPEAKAHEPELMSLVLLSDEVSFNPKSVIESDGLTARISDTLKRLKRLETWA